MLSCDFQKHYLPQVDKQDQVIHRSEGKWFRKWLVLSTTSRDHRIITMDTITTPSQSRRHILESPLFGRFICGTCLYIAQVQQRGLSLSY